MTTQPDTPIARAIEHLGGKSVSLAAKLGVTEACVSQWVHGLRRIPLERAVQIELATAGAVTRQELVPEVNWKLLMTRPARRRASPPMGGLSPKGAPKGG